MTTSESICVEPDHQLCLKQFAVESAIYRRECTTVSGEKNACYYDTVQPLNVFGSFPDCETSVSLTGGRSPDPLPSSFTLPSLTEAVFCKTENNVTSKYISIYNNNDIGF